MLAVMEVGGNPSSVHGEGRAARKLLSDARDKLGFWLGCLPQMITFTSGGTEANNLALRGVDVDRVLVSAVEHPSVLSAAKASGRLVEIIPVDKFGRVELGSLEKMLAGPKTLVSVMLAFVHGPSLPLGPEYLLLRRDYGAGGCGPPLWYYNQERPHRTLGLQTPQLKVGPTTGIRSRPLLNGLHHVYERAA